MKRSDSIQLKRSTSRIQKVPFVGDKIDLLQPISVKQFRKLLPLLPPNVNETFPNRIKQYQNSRDYLVLSSKRQQDINILLSKAYRGLYSVPDVVNYLVQFRDLKRRQVSQFIIPYTFDGVVNWYQMIRHIYSKSRQKQTSRSIQDLIVHIQRNYRKTKSQQISLKLGNQFLQLMPSAPKGIQALISKLKKSFRQSIKSLRSTFQAIDKNVNGQIDKSEFEQALTTIGMKLDPKQTQLIFKQFDKNNEGFFKYQHFVQFIFGVKQLSSQKGYLNTLPLILQQIKSDLKKIFQSAELFVKDINAKLSKYSQSRQFSPNFLCDYFDSLLGYKKYSHYQMRQVLKQLYQSIQYVKGLYNHIFKKPIEKKVQSAMIVIPQPRSTTLDKCINIVYHFLSINPSSKVILRKCELVQELKLLFDESIVNCFFYIFKVGDFFRPSNLKDLLKITKLAATIYIQKTITQREEIKNKLRDRFDDQLCLAGRNLSNAVLFHLQYQLSSSDQAFLKIQPYKMYKVLPLFQELLDFKFEEVQKLILNKLAKKFKYNYLILKEKNNHSKQMAMFAIDLILDKVMASPRKRRSSSKIKIPQLQIKKSVKPANTTSLRPAINIATSDFIVQAKEIILNLVMNLPQKIFIKKKLDNVYKQHVYVKQSSSFIINYQNTRLAYNNVLGGIAADSQNIYYFKDNNINKVSLEEKVKILDFVLYQNQVISFGSKGKLHINVLKKDNIPLTTFQIPLTNQNQLKYSYSNSKTKFLKIIGNNIIVNLSLFDNSINSINTSTFKSNWQIRLNSQEHFITTHIKNALQKIRSQALQRFPNHPKDFFREILSKTSIDKKYFITFITKQVPKLFPSEVEQILNFIQTKSNQQILLLDIIKFLYHLDLFEIKTSNYPMLDKLKQQLVKYINSNNITIIDLIDKIGDTKQGHISVYYLESFITTLPGLNNVPEKQLFEALQVYNNKISYQSFINFVSSYPNTVSLKDKMYSDILSIITKQKKSFQLTRLECEELFYKHLTFYSHQQINSWLNWVYWEGNKHLFKFPIQTSKLSLWFPNKISIQNYWYQQSYNLLIYSVNNCNKVFISEINGSSSSLLGIIEHSSELSLSPAFLFIQQGLCLITHSKQSLKIWNIHSLLIKQKSVFPPWNFVAPTKTIVLNSQIIFLQQIGSSGIIVATSKQSARFINIHSGQQLKKISFKTKQIIQSQVCSQQFKNSNSLSSILLLLKNNSEYVIQQLFFQVLSIKIPGNQTQYKIPIKIKQSLDEQGINFLNKKLKFSQVHKNNMNYVVRSRNVADNSLKMYFYKDLKKAYLFDQTQSLQNTYDLKVFLNQGLNIYQVVSLLRQLSITYIPSSSLINKIRQTKPSKIEPIYKQYQYEESYQNIFLQKLNRQSKIHILQNLEALDYEQLDVQTLTNVLSKIEPSITREQMQVLLQNYQKPSTPLQKYYIPLTFFRNILVRNNTNNYIYRKINKLINKAKQQRPGYYGFQLFGRLEDKLTASQIRQRLLDIGLKLAEIDIIITDKTHVIQKQYMDIMKQSLEYFQVPHTTNKIESINKRNQQIQEVVSQQQNPPKQEQQQVNKKQININNKQQTIINMDNPKQQIQVKQPNEPEIKNPEEIKRLSLDRIYIKIANNFGLRDLQQIFLTPYTFQKDFTQRIQSLSSLDDEEKLLLFNDLKNPIKRIQIDIQLLKMKYYVVVQKLRQQRLNQIQKQLIEHLVLSINFKKLTLITVLKQYWCSDEGVITLPNFQQFVQDTGFTIKKSHLILILTKLNVLNNNSVSALLIQKIFQNNGYAFEKSMLQHKKWINNTFSLLNQLVKQKQFNKSIKNCIKNANSNFISFVEFYKALKSVTLNIIPQDSLKLLVNLIFSGNQLLPVEFAKERLFSFIENSPQILTPKHNITIQQFVQLIVQSNPFNQIFYQITNIQKQLRSNLVMKTIANIRGIGIVSFNNLTQTLDDKLNKCSSSVPTVEQQEYSLPSLKRQSFINQFTFTVQQIQYTNDQDMDNIGYIVNSKFEGYKDEELCKRKLGVRRFLSNLHNSDVQYFIGDFYCLEGFNPAYYLPNGAINFDWKLIIIFSQRILEQINKVHEIGYCLTNLRYTHIGRNAIIQQVYYPSKITNTGKIQQKVNVLKQYSRQDVYIAPQLSNESFQKSSKIDSWSFGCLLFEFVFGRLLPKSYKQSNSSWLQQDLIRTILNLQHQQISDSEFNNQKGLIGIRLLLDGFKNIYNNSAQFSRNYDILNQILKIIDLCLNHNPKHRPSTQQLSKYQIFQSKNQATNQQNQQVLSITSNIMKNGGLAYRYKYAVHISELQNLNSLDDQVNIMAQSIPMVKIKQILVNPISKQLQYWIQEQQYLNFNDIIQKTTNLFISTSNKYFPELPSFTSLPSLPESVFSESINRSKINLSIQNKWIKLLMNLQFFECMTYLICKSRNKDYYELYYKLITELLRQLKKYESSLVFYVERILIQILKMSFGISIGFSNKNQHYLRKLITDSLNQQFIDEFNDPTLLSLSSDFDYELSKDYIKLFAQIITDDGLPSTIYQPIYQYFITNPDKLRYFDSMGNILKLQVSLFSNGMANPKSRELTMNRMQQIIEYINDRNIDVLEDSKCHLLFMSILNNSDQQIRKKGLKYFQTLINKIPTHPIFSSQVLLLSLFGNLRFQSEKTANKVISLKIFKIMIANNNQQSKKLKGSYFNTLNEILRLSITPKQRSLETSNYLELKPFVQDIMTHFKQSSDWTKIVDAIQGSQTIMGAIKELIKN